MREREGVRDVEKVKGWGKTTPKCFKSILITEKVVFLNCVYRLEIEKTNQWSGYAREPF